MATRVYFPSINGSAPISPAYDAAWELTSSVPAAARLSTNHVSNGAAARQLSPGTVSSVPFDHLLAQYVSDPLSAQSISGTVKGRLKAWAQSTTPDAMSQVIIRVVSPDGTVVRGTLLAADTSAFSNEVSTGGAFGVNHQFPNVDNTALSSVSAQEGDRLVIELGLRYNTTGAFGGIIPGIHVGSTSASDLPEDQTDTTTNIWPWLEFSQTLNFQAPTRFYLNQVDAMTEITPAVDAGWEVTVTSRFRMNTFKRNSAFATLARAETNASAAIDVFARQYISQPLNAQTITGTVKGIIRCMEDAADADFKAQSIIRVVSRDGTVVRGTLVGFDASGLASEFPTGTLTNRKFPFAWTDGGATITTLAVQQGDRIVIEFGARAHNATATSKTASFECGDASGSDLAENETDTTQGNPWFEFNPPLSFENVDTTDRRGLEEFNLTELGPDGMPHGGPIAMVANTIPALGESSSGFTKRRARGNDQHTRLGIIQSELPDNSGASYGAQGLLESGHSSAELFSQTRPTQIAPLPPVVLRNTVAPLITSMTPAPGVITRLQQIDFDVTDDLNSFTRIVVEVVHSSGLTEVVHDGDALRYPYLTSSARSPISGGFHYIVRRGDDLKGWPSASFTLRVFAIDAHGNEGTPVNYAYTVSNPDLTIPTFDLFSPAKGASIAVAGAATFRAFDVGGNTSTLPSGQPTIKYVKPDGTIETVYNGTSFVSPFNTSSTRTGSFQENFSIVRTGGWLAGQVVLDLYAVDGDGNIKRDLYELNVTNPNPTITNFVPAASSNILNDASAQFDVTDDTGLFRRIVVFASYAGGLDHVVYDGTVFTDAYDSASTVTPISGGSQFFIKKNGGFHAGLSFTIVAIDQAGGEATATYPLTVTNPVPAAGADVDPPEVGNFSPAQGSTISANQPLTFDVTDDSGGFRRIIVTVTFPKTGIEEVVHDGDAFRGLYLTSSHRTMIAGGFRYSLLRTGGWPSSPTIKAFAIDEQGNEGTA